MNYYFDQFNNFYLIKTLLSEIKIFTILSYNKVEIVIKK